MGRKRKAKKVVKKKKEWLTYEEIITKAYTAFYKGMSSEYVVKHNDFIKGHQSNTERQIDVSITGKLGAEVSQLIIVSAKYYKKPASITIIDELWGVMNDVKATKGVLICRGGYTKNTVIYARNLGIEVCTFNYLENLSVEEMISIPVIFVYYEKVQVAIKVELIADEFLATKPKNFIDSASFEDNKTYSDPYEIFASKWNEGALNKSVGNHYQEIKGINAVFGNHKIPLTHLGFEYVVNKRGKIEYTAPSEYYSLQHRTKSETQEFLKVSKHFSEDHTTWPILNNIDELEKSYPGLHIVFTVNETMTRENLTMRNVAFI